MKFKDMVEDKVYNSNVDKALYSKLNGLLWNETHQAYSEIHPLDILGMSFIEIDKEKESLNNAIDTLKSYCEGLGARCDGCKIEKWCDKNIAPCDWKSQDE